MNLFPFLFVFMALINLDLSNAYGMHNVEDIEHAQELPKSKVVFNRNWRTVERLEVLYKEKSFTFYVANSFNADSYWGEIAIYAPCPQGSNNYPGDLNTYGYFSDTGLNPPLSHLPYEYVSGEGTYFLLEKINITNKSTYFFLEQYEEIRNCDFKENFFHRLSVNYFLNNFVKRTNVSSVFSAEDGEHLFEKEEAKEQKSRKVSQRKENEQKPLRKRKPRRELKERKPRK